jgi:hypothetical protein
LKKLAVLHKVDGAVEISKAGGINNTVQSVQKTIQRTPENQFAAPSKVWPLVLEQHLQIFLTR